MHIPHNYPFGRREGTFGRVQGDLEDLDLDDLASTLRRTRIQLDHHFETYREKKVEYEALVEQVKEARAKVVESCVRVEELAKQKDEKEEELDAIVSKLESGSIGAKKDELLVKLAKQQSLMAALVTDWHRAARNHAANEKMYERKFWTFCSKKYEALNEESTVLWTICQENYEAERASASAARAHYLANYLAEEEERKKAKNAKRNRKNKERKKRQRERALLGIDAASAAKEGPEGEEEEEVEETVEENVGEDEWNAGWCTSHAPVEEEEEEEEAEKSWPEGWSTDW